MSFAVRCIIISFTVLALFSSPSYAENKAILIGISQYSDPDMSDLAYADKDVEAFHSVLVDFAGYKPSDIAMLLNSRATKNEISNAIVSTVKKSQKQPLNHFILMFAGHGVPAKIQSSKTNSFLAPHDAAINQFFLEGELMSNETFINRAWLVKQLSSIKAKQIIIILDSCYSGAKDFGELFAQNLGLNVNYMGSTDGSRGVVVVKRKVGYETVENSIAFIASSKDNQQSAEYRELKHGALTYAIFEYLNNVRKETDINEQKEITVGNVYANISKMFDTVKVSGTALSAVHQPVLFPIPDYDNVKGMKFVSVRGTKMLEIKPEIKPEIKTGTIHITTDPEGAEIYVNGATTGRYSNSILELPEGKHMVSLYLSKTNYSHTFIVDIKAGIKEQMRILLRGDLEVESYSDKPGQTAPKLDVYLDGQHMGKTELNLKNLVAGTHTLKVHTEGVTKERHIEIRPASPLLVRYKTIRVQAPPPVKKDEGVMDVTF
jgi:hypothetical protein